MYFAGSDGPRFFDGPAAVICFMHPPAPEVRLMSRHPR